MMGTGKSKIAKIYSTDRFELYEIGLRCFINHPTLQYLQESEGVVARVDMDIQGFCTWIKLDDAMIIDRICVDPSMRRLGIGTELVRSVERRAKKRNRAVEVFVNEYNLPTQLFFKALGYVAIASGKFITMRKA